MCFHALSHQHVCVHACISLCELYTSAWFFVHLLDMKFNFQTVQGSVVNDVGYDYESIMHYGPYAFAVRRGLVTISTRDGSNKIGQRQGLSAKDVEQARKLYKCSGGTTGGGTTGGGTTGGGTTGGGTTGGGNTGRISLK